MLRFFIAPGLVLASLAATTRTAPEYQLTLQDHVWQPAELKLPANTRINARVTNQDATPSEFESNDFNREKFVMPGSTVTVFIGPPDRSHYEFFDDFHPDTACGVLILE